MNMSRLDMFLILIPMNFIKDTVINKTTEKLDVSRKTQEYIKWVGCWLYMSCWVGVCNQRDWWSTAAPLRYKVAPF